MQSTPPPLLNPSRPSLSTPPAPRVERYEIVRQIGQGGMGVVYEAFDRRRERRVAMKVLKDPERGSLYRFKREFRAASQLLHPNLVRLFDLGTLPDGSLFFTMEFLTGHSLSSFAATIRNSGGPQPAPLAETLLSPKDLTAAPQHAFDDTLSAQDLVATPKEPSPAALSPIISGILEGLRFLHSARKVHRDLKPANVMIDANGEAKLLDFGIVRELDAPNHETITQGIIGTPVYMSPEQVSSKEITPAADIYSFGCLLYELLAGAPPFVGATARVMAQHLTEAPKPPSSIRPCPPILEEICLWALQKEPERRPSAEELLQRLHRDASGPALRTINRQAHRSPGLLGREKELRRLEDGYNAVGPRSKLLLIAGESGSGKSALGAEFVQSMQQLGVSTWLGRCYEREHVPYKALDAIVDSIAVALSKRRGDVLRLLPVGAASLLRIFPVLREAIELPETASETTLRDAKAERLRAIRSLFLLLKNLSGDKPPLLVIDDLQWADEESFEALAWLLNAPDAPACFVVANYRSEEVGDDHSMGRLLHGADRLQLGVLSDQALFSLVDAYSTSTLRVENKKRLIEEANRNPLLVVELSRVFREGEQLPKLSSVVEERLSRVSKEARHLLEISAAAGGKLSFPLLSKLSGFASARVAEALDELLRTELLRESLAHEQEAFDVAHDKLRQAAYQAIDHERRRGLHAQLAEFLEEQDDAARAVEHWKLANEPQRAKESALAAAKRAEGQLAFGRAAALYGLAGEGETTSPLKVSRAESLSKAGLRKEAARAFEEAAACSDADLREVKLRAAAEHIAAGQFQDGVRTFQTLLVPYQVPLKKPKWRRFLWLACSVVFASFMWVWFDLAAFFGRKPKIKEIPTERDFQMRLFLTIHQSLFAFDALTAAEFGLRFSYMAYHAGSLSYLGMARLIHGRSFIAGLGNAFARRGFHHIQEGEAYCAEANNIAGLLEAQISRALLHTFSGNRVAIGHVSERCEELARRGGLFGSPTLMLAREMSVGADYFAGDFRGAINRADSYIADSKSRGTIIECVTPLTLKGLSHLAFHEVDEARACFDEVNTICAKTPLMLVQYRSELMQTELLLYEGRLKEGLARLDQVEAWGKAQGVFASNIESTFLTLQRWRFFLCQKEREWSRVSFWRLSFALSSAPVTIQAGVFRVQAALHARRGHPRGALGYLERALFITEQNNNFVSSASVYAARAAVKRKFNLPGAAYDQEVSEALLKAQGITDSYFYRTEGWNLL